MNTVGRTFRSLVFFLCAGTFAPTGSQAREVNRDALRQIVQNSCLVQWTEQLRPTPCESVSLSGADAASEGYAVLADIKGGAHFLLIPTRTIAGIESAEILVPQAPNYFAAAWQAREDLAEKLGRAVARDNVGLAVNSQRARSQDQLHIHIECLGPTIYRALKASARRLNDAWSPIDLGGFQYQGLRVMGENLDDTNPFRLLAERMPGAAQDMGAYTLLVTGMQFEDGPGFIVLAGKNAPGAETFLDSNCTIAIAGSR